MCTVHSASTTTTRIYGRSRHDRLLESLLRSLTRFLSLLLHLCEVTCSSILLRVIQ